MDTGSVIIVNYKFQITNFKLRHGYTLLELLVSIGIIIILAAVTIPGLGSKRNINELNDIALDFRSKLVQAQSYALSPPSDNSNGAIYGTAYGVAIKDDGTEISYSIVKKLSDGTATFYPIGSNSLTNKSVKINAVNPIGATTVWYKIGTTIKIETDTTNSPVGDLVFTFGIRNGAVSEVRTVSVSSATGAINAT